SRTDARNAARVLVLRAMIRYPVEVAPGDEISFSADECKKRTERTLTVHSFEAPSLEIGEGKTGAPLLQPAISPENTVPDEDGAGSLARRKIRLRLLPGAPSK